MFSRNNPVESPELSAESTTCTTKGRRFWTLDSSLSTAGKRLRTTIAALLTLALTSLALARDLSVTVNGLVLSGTRTKSVALTVCDRRGEPNPAIQPGIAVLHGDTWSPTDPVREGAREFKVFLTVAKLIRESPLSAVIGITSRNGLLLPESAHALNRSVLMGVPVVTVSIAGQVQPDATNLFVEAGRLNETDARAVLAQCMLRYGNFQPSADPANPTPAELASLQRQVMQYQASFDAANSARQFAAL